MSMVWSGAATTFFIPLAPVFLVCLQGGLYHLCHLYRLCLLYRCGSSFSIRGDRRGTRSLPNWSLDSAPGFRGEGIGVGKVTIVRVVITGCILELRAYTMIPVALISKATAIIGVISNTIASIRCWFGYITIPPTTVNVDQPPSITSTKTTCDNVTRSVQSS